MTQKSSEFIFDISQVSILDAYVDADHAGAQQLENQQLDLLYACLKLQWSGVRDYKRV